MGKGGVRTDRFNTLLVFASIPLRLSSKEKKERGGRGGGREKGEKQDVEIVACNNLWTQQFVRDRFAHRSEFAG